MKVFSSTSSFSVTRLIAVVYVAALIAAALSPAQAREAGGAQSSGASPTNPFAVRAAALPGVIAFASRRADYNYEVYLMNADGSDVTRLTYTLADDRQPSVSRDGTKIAFISDRGNVLNAPYDIYVMDIDGTNVQRLTTKGDAGNSASVITLSWSPDGTTIALAKQIGGVPLFHVYALDVRTLALTDLTPGAPDSSSPDWSPDGTRIAFIRNSGFGNALWTMNADGSNQKGATWGAFNMSHPTWSPDGSRIAYLTYNGGSYVGVADATTGMHQRILSHTRNASSVSWGPDGLALTFTAFDQDADAAYPDIYRADVADTTRTRLTAAAVGDESASWAPGAPPHVAPPLAPSGRVAYAGGHWVRDQASSDSLYGLFTMNADGWDIQYVAPLQRTSTVGSETAQYVYDQVSFSQDGAQIVAVRATSINGLAPERDIAVLDGDGTHERVLPLSGIERLPHFTPDGSEIVFLTNRYAAGCNSFCDAMAVMNADGSGLYQESSYGAQIYDFDLRSSSLDTGDDDVALAWGGSYYIFGVGTNNLSHVIEPQFSNEDPRFIQSVGAVIARRDNQSYYPPVTGYPPDGMWQTFRNPTWANDGNSVAYVRETWVKDPPGGLVAEIRAEVVVDDNVVYALTLPPNAQGGARVPDLRDLAWSPQNGKLVFAHDGGIVSTLNADGTNLTDLTFSAIGHTTVNTVIGWVPSTATPGSVLPGAIGAGDTCIPVSDTSFFSLAGGYALIGTELVSYTGLGTSCGAVSGARAGGGAGAAATAGALTGVTRNLNGQGSAHTAGTTVTPAVAPAACVGDCDGNAVVSIGEVSKCINMFLGQPLALCPVSDANQDGHVSIGEVTQCVNRFLNGC